MVSKHYKGKRSKREKFIKECLGGDGQIIDSFIIDKGHKDGIEKHCVTENGIIVIYNVKSGKLVTKKIARPQQIKNLYAIKNKAPPKWLLDLSAWHTIMGMNYL